MAVRWYLRYGLSYRDVEELMAERGVQVDRVTIYRWVRPFTPILAETAAVPGTRSGPDGKSMRLMSRSPDVGGTSTGPWMRMAR